uniref:Putative secreted protein n=1 Tax=Anopheles marajoara TaxID=58244 RepID=A0A2M4C8J4_9DIPT
MLVIARFLELSLLVLYLLALRKQRLLRSMILHRTDALFLQILVYLGIIHRIDRHRAPQLLEVFVNLEVGRTIVVVQDLFLIVRPGNENDLRCTVLQHFITVW